MEVRAAHWQLGGRIPRRCGSVPKPEMVERFPRQIPKFRYAGVRKMFDGYDAGVLVMTITGRSILAKLNVDDETVVMLSDHGETLGELNVYGDHQTADQITTRLPLLLYWPGVAVRR